MSRYPSATWRPLPQNSTQGRIAPRKVILHTAVDAPGPSSLHGYFKSGAGGTGAEAHFFVRTDGSVEQYMDTNVRADANYAANRDAISIETEDDGNPATPWTDAQQRAICALLVWACDTHDIPRRLAKSSSDAGIGWHSQFREWNRSGHQCPGPVRQSQIPWLVLAIAMPSAPAPVPAPAPATPKRPVLRRGSHGKCVTALQYSFVFLGTPLALDGDYGPATEDAVRRLQAFLRLKADGICGPATWKAIDELVTLKGGKPVPC